MELCPMEVIQTEPYPMVTTPMERPMGVTPMEKYQPVAMV